MVIVTPDLRLPSQPRITAHWPMLYFHTAEGRRLSCLFNYVYTICYLLNANNTTLPVNAVAIIACQITL